MTKFIDVTIYRTKFIVGKLQSQKCKVKMHEIKKSKSAGVVTVEDGHLRMRHLRMSI